MMENRAVWQVIYNSCKAFEVRRLERSVWKRILRKMNLISIPDTFQPEYVSNIRPKAGLASHMKSHDSK